MKHHVEVTRPVRVEVGCTPHEFLERLLAVFIEAADGLVETTVVSGYDFWAEPGTPDDLAIHGYRPMTPAEIESADRKSAVGKRAAIAKKARKEVAERAELERLSKKYLGS